MRYRETLSSTLFAIILNVTITPNHKLQLGINDPQQIYLISYSSFLLLEQEKAKQQQKLTVEKCQKIYVKFCCRVSPFFFFIKQLLYVLYLEQ